jgi:hypothetical protein
MKSEHRHELAENDLSKLLGRWAEKFEEHSNTILSVFVVLALIAAAAIYWTRSSWNQRESGWTQLVASSNPQDFESVADAFSGTPVAEWARLRAASGFLRDGIERSVSDRSVSNELLQKARSTFESLTDEGTNPAVREQALNGLAVTLESLSDGDTQAAIAAYQKLLTEFPETRFKTFAEDRIEALKTGRVQEFYAWFRKQNPEPPDRPLPQDQPASAQDPLAPLLPGGAGPKLGDTPFEVPSPGDEDSQSPADDLNPFEQERPGDVNRDEPESAEGQPPSTSTPSTETPAEEDTSPAPPESTP